MSSSRLLRAVRGSIGLGLAVGMVAWVVDRSGIDPVTVLSTVDRRLFALAFTVYGIGLLSASWRWYLLLHHIRVALPFLTVIRLALIGLFFNLFVPGGVGGDVIKMIYLKRDSGPRYPQALLTVLLDRLLGLAGLLLLTLVALAGNRTMVASGSREMKGLLGVVGLACLGGLVAVLGFAAWPWLVRWGGQSVTRWSRRLPPLAVSVGVKVVEALDLLRAAPAKLLGFLALSTVGHLTAAIGVYLVARGVSGEVGPLPDFSACLLATQLSNLVAAIPLTPGGLGGRDLVMSLLLQAAGSSAALAGAVPVLISVLLIGWSLVGGLALLWERETGLGSAGLQGEGLLSGDGDPKVAPPSSGSS